MRKWKTAIKHDTQWQTLHISEDVINEWRTLAFMAGAKVSDLDLVASWIHLVGFKKRAQSQSILYMY